MNEWIDLYIDKYYMWWEAILWYSWQQQLVKVQHKYLSHNQLILSCSLMYIALIPKLECISITLLCQLQPNRPHLISIVLIVWSDEIVWNADFNVDVRNTSAFMLIWGTKSSIYLVLHRQDLPAQRFCKSNNIFGLLNNIERKRKNASIPIITDTKHGKKIEPLQHKIIY